MGDVRERLQEAALELFTERGYQVTTVDAIAERAGVTQRTFFRYFGDKGEVLFDDDGELLAVLVEAVTRAPPGEPVLQVVRRGLLALAAHMQPARDELRRRAAAIDAESDLRERELLKLDRWRARLIEALVDRGTSAAAAAVAVGASAACFEVAYRSWLGDRARTSLARRVDKALALLREL
jgi:AcrR family transcriptional regulator